MKTSLNKCHFLFVQEHCLYLSQLPEFYELGHILYHGNSAMDESKCNIGRPNGGCAIIWHAGLNCSVTPVDHVNNRMCCVKVAFANGLTALMINVYMPCDERYQGDNYNELENLVSDIMSVLNDYDCDIYILGGDLNADFHRNTPHVNFIKNMLQAVNLRSGISHVCSNVDYTFESKGTGTRSVIDHLCFSDNVFHSLSAFCTEQSIENPSDHDLLMCCLEIADVSNTIKVSRAFKPRAAWYKASSVNINEYKHTIDILLQTVVVPYDALQCNNVRCSLHNNAIEKFHNEIITACLNGEDKCIPKTGFKNKCIPGWNEYVKEKQYNALYFHQLWKAAGRPQHGDLATNMRQARKDYHYAIRFCKRETTCIQAQKMAEYIEKKDVSNFWREVKRFRNNSKTTTTKVDNADDPQAIADLFYGKFKTVYTSVPYDQADLQDINATINDLLDKDYRVFENGDDKCLSVDNIIKLVHKIKAGKHDGNNGPTSDCIINGSHRLFIYLSLLYRGMLTHCCIPKDLLVGTMFPLPKVKGLTTCSEKYRAITLSSCLLKLFDLIVLTNQSESLYTDVLQFGFKPDYSTNLCTAVLSEVTRLFISSKSNVYTLFLDASKAFDRVHYIKLFRLLISRGMNIMFVKFLLKLYTNQTLRVNWQNSLSDQFYVTNGVRQGGVLSPVLFIVYINELLQLLRNSGCGCYVGPHFLGALAYADDIVLISPTIVGLKHMSSVCESFSADYCIIFNGAKSQYCVFNGGKHSGNSSIMFCNVILKESKVVTHLGYKLFSNVKVHSADETIAAFYRQFNMFKCCFSSLPSAIQMDLFEKYCSSFYGCVLIPFTQCLKKLQVTWRKALRQIWRLSNRTHCYIVKCLSSGNCDLHMFVNRFLKFFLNMYNHSVSVIRHVCRVSLCSSLSVLYENFIFCCNALKFEQNLVLAKTSQEISKIVRSFFNSNCKNVTNQCCTDVVRELCNVRDKMSQCILNRDEVQCIINVLCTN